MRVLLALLCPALASALWPIPQHVSSGTRALVLAPHFEIAVPAAYPADVRAAAARTSAFLRADKLARLVPGRGTSDAALLVNSGTLQALDVRLAPGAPKTGGIAAETLRPLGQAVESYNLTVPASGRATLTAHSALGLARGLTTFGQMWWTLRDDVYMLTAPMEIEDAPAYPYRGLMLDTARNFFPVADIKRTLDTMSWVKMSHFHWHITDAQSFPLVVPALPALAEKGAYSSDEIYSVADVRDIVTYAAARGISVVPEIDTPGHTTSIAAAYPQHIACAERAPWADYANEPPAGQLRFASPSTASFAAQMFDSAAGMFDGALFGTGGDELNTACYKKDAETQAILKQKGWTLEHALDVFTQGTHAALRKKGKAPVVWEEMALVHNVSLGPDTLVLVWISPASAKAVAARGLPLIHAPSDYFYLDCGSGEWIGDTPDATSWCDPFKSWQRAYTFDPLANLTRAEAKLVRGGQQLLWTEQSGPGNVDTQLWPRAAVSAELFWSGPAVTNVTEALPRLHELAFRVQARGTRVTPLQPMWCALRPGKCGIAS